LFNEVVEIEIWEYTCDFFSSQFEDWILLHFDCNFIKSWVFIFSRLFVVH